MDIIPIRLLDTALHRIPHHHIQHLQEPLAQCRGLNGRGHLNPPFRIAGHKVRRGDIHPLALTLSEHIDSCVLQKTPHHAVYCNRIRMSWDPAVQAADSPDNQVDLHPGLRCLDELINQHLIAQGVEFDDNAPAGRAFGTGNFPVNHLDHLALQAQRRYQQLFGILHQAADGQAVEHDGGIRADIPVGGHQGIVRIQTGSFFVVVPGSNLSKILHMVTNLAGDEQQLGMHLVFIQAVNHRTARFFQLFGPADIVFLVKPGPQLHHHQDVLPILRSADQGVYHLGIGRHPVQRYLDGYHAVILRGLVEQPDKGLDALIGVAEQNIVLGNLPHHGDNPYNGRGVLRGQRFIEQIRRGFPGNMIFQFSHKGKIQRALGDEHVLLRELQPGAQGFHQFHIDGII